MNRTQMETYLKEQLEDMSEKLREYLRTNDFNFKGEMPALTMAIYPEDGIAWAYMIHNKDAEVSDEDRYAVDVEVFDR